MRVFITGLTGTLGTALALHHQQRGDQVWGCSRSEEKAVRWLEKYPRLGTLYLTNASSLIDIYPDASRAMASCDRCYHLAAMKHVDLCEEQPWEAFVQNVTVTEMVALACERAKVPLIFVSSDKACLPQGVYGATKLLGERIVVRAGGAVVRLGNIVGSSGSVFQAWASAVKEGRPIKVTDPEMTRYFLGVGQAAVFVAEGSAPGKVVIPHPLRAARMGDLAEGMARQCRSYRPTVQVVGARPGETRHQWLVAPGERVTVDEAGGRLVLGGVDRSRVDEEEVEEDGRCSATSPLWDTEKLLKLAGV